VYGGARFGGSTALDTAAPAAAVPKLGTGFEAGAGIEDRRLSHVAFVARVGGVSWATALPAGDARRTHAFALTFAPVGRLAIGPVELRALAAFGFTVGETADLGPDLGLGDGYHVDLGGGAHAAFGAVGVLVELGWSSHWLTWRTEVDLPDIGPTQVPVELRVQQPFLRVALTVAL
jgi:hypothetical protein